MEENVVELDLNQLQALVRKTLVKLLQKSGYIKGFVLNVKKEMASNEDPDTDGAIKEEVEQSLSEMITMFRKKYKVGL